MRIEEVLLVMNEILELFNSKKKYQDYFKNDIETIELLLKRLQSNDIKIGMVGATSSGKSMLINALLHEELLPTRVRPSTGCEVTCEYGIEKMAIIEFENKQPKKIRNEIKTNVLLYGDETNNSGNRLGVSKIAIKSPDWLLHKDTQLIDTPGLDAYGLDVHQKITLQMILPFLDMVLFLTTVKSNSSKTNIINLDKITEDDKPLLIVQNMIDSVEPKIGKGGVILKSSEVVLREHLESLKSILRYTKKKSTQEAQIIQISALEGVKGNYESSNINKLIYVINNNREYVIKKNNQIRLKNLNQMIKTIISLLNNSENGEDVIGLEIAEIQSKLKEINEKSKDRERNCHNLHQKAGEELQELNEYTKELILQTNLTDHKAVTDRVNKHFTNLKKMINDMSDYIAVYQKYCSQTAAKLNICLKDSYKPGLAPNLSAPAISTKEVRVWEQRTVLKERAWFNPLRYFVDKYYEETIDEEVSKYYIDVEGLINSINLVAGQWTKWFQKNMIAFDSLFNSQINNFSENLNQNIISLEEKEKKILLKEEKKELSDKLSLYIKKIRQCIDFNLELEVPIDEKIKTSEPKKIMVPKYIKQIIKLATIESTRHNIEMFKECLNHFNDKNEIVIWGWDNSDINRFINLFIMQNEDCVLEEKYYNKLVYDKKVFHIYNESLPNENHSIIKSSNVVLLVDIKQIGLTKTNIARSELNFSEYKEVVLVIQSLKALINDGSIVEGFIELKQYLQSSSLKVKNILVSEKERLFTFLLNFLYMQSDDKLMNYSNTTKLAEILDFHNKSWKVNNKDFNLLVKFVKEYINEIKVRK